MASSDDEAEAVPHTVSNYHFVNDKDEPIAFSELPVQWNEGEGLDGNIKQIFLHGTTDNGLQKIYKQVTSWKFDLSNVKPEMSVLSKENNWIKLQKPRKSFEETIRSILIAVHCLHFMKKNPETSGRSLWDHLSKVFSSYEARPSENDLIDHTTLINEAVKRDETLAKSKFLVTFLEEKPWKKRAFDEDNGTTTKTRFIVDDDMIDQIEEDDGSDEEDDLFDSVCAICDNGGELLCCEGRCMRSFHATGEAGFESTCESLGLSDGQVDAIQNFFCANCKYKQHQCFSCGELGSSDKLSGAEVFPCVSATCGRFYHPHCVAKLLHRENAAEAEEIQKKIAAGESFTCPIHKCIVCKQGENKMDPDFQFAVCRRCPKSYHRKCLPGKIAFEDLEDEGIIQRAWEGLMPNRILIYCLKHEIDDEIGTPIRNHIIFPGDGQKKRKQISQQLSSKEKVLKKGRSLALEDDFRKRTLGKVHKGVGSSSTIKEIDSSKKSVIRSTGPNYSKKQRVADASIKLKTKSIKSTDESGPSLGGKLYDFMKKGSESPDTDHKQTPTDKPVAKKMSSQLPLDEDSKRRILALMKDATSSVTLEEIIKKHKVPTTHAYSSKYVVDKAITLGKVEGSVEALRAALQKLEEGCSIEDAKAVCEPGLLHQIIRWKNKLRVYLAPFLYGMRYTSFGRHFTKVDKLKEIVNVLHCYVQDGDMIVDFCCGANDFSWLMKKQLDETGKKCSYKNYDVLQAKNDFNFEKRDWMSIRPKELPPGSQLIMGLNPPFGVNASLANKFIDKALEFKPKLLILIVPRETERLDKKKTPYDLLWEDDKLLVGKSFYLPGSVDVNDNQMEDWNVNPPPLYLWSRPDWTARHKAIAQQHGHLSRVRERSHLQENHSEPLVSDYPMKDNNLNSQTSKPMDDHPVQNEVHEQLQEKGASVSENHKEGFPRDNAEREVHEKHEKHSHGKYESNEDSNKRRRDKGKQGRGSGEASQKGREKRQSSPVSEMYNRRPRRSPPNVTSGRSLDGRSSRPLEVPSHMEVSKEGDQHFDDSVAGSRSHFQTGYGGVHSDGVARGYGGAYSDDIARRYGSNGEEPYSGGTHRWSSGATPGPDYGVRNSEEQFAGYQREGTETHGYRSYLSEIEERHARESAVRSQVQCFGQQDPNTFDQRSTFLAGQDHLGFSSSYNYNIMSSAADSSYSRMNTSTSTMQRYAPRLDELNHTRTNPLGYEQPTAGRNGIPDPLAPQPGYRVDSLGFAPGPYRSFSQQNSSGWLNE